MASIVFVTEFVAKEEGQPDRETDRRSCLEASSSSLGRLLEVSMP
ncbi:MAG: hypothetical protein R2706_08585 [Acidimicrobiales bacterium]